MDGHSFFSGGPVIMFLSSFTPAKHAITPMTVLNSIPSGAALPVMT